MYANSLLATLLSEKDEKKLIGKSIAGLYDNAKQREDFFKQVKKNTVIPAKHIQLKRADKTSIRVALTARLTHFNNSSCILITLQDTSQQGEQISSMRNELVRQSVALRAAEVGIWSWNWTTKKVVWDDIMHDLFGLQRGTYSGSEKEFFERIHPEDRDEQYRQRAEFRKSKESNVFESQYRIVRPDGETRVITMRGTAEKNPDNLITGAVGACWDVTHSYAVAAKLEHQVLFDPLTKLLNRSELQRRLRKMLTRLQDEYSENVFCYFDIDRFKVINETCGHKAGDVLLQEVSEILRNHVKKADTLARMGGDEFGLLLQNCSTNNAKKVAEILCKAIDEFHFEWDGNVFDINISMGLIGVTADHQSVSRVLSLADIALSAAKDSGGNRIHVYHPYDSTLTRRHEEMQSIVELESALHENRFKLFAQSIQPIANNTHEGLHYEVLLRVIDAFGEVVMPGELLSAAEHFDLATRVDKWVINAVFDWLKNNPAIVKN